MKLLTSTLMAAAVFGAATSAVAEPQNYVLDPSHSQIVFSYNHLGYSTTYGMFSGFEGEITFDQENPAASSVAVTMPVRSMITGWEERFSAFMSADFLDTPEGDGELVSFSSTSIQITGEATALISGDLTLNGTTKSVVLDAKLNATGMHPLAQREWAGFDATTTLSRSDYGLGAFVPFIGDEVEVLISIEAMLAD